MHIPDGILDLKTAAATGALAGAGLAVALHQARKSLPPRKVPLLGLAAAFVFAAQMINFPVMGGTSGHLIGGTLSAVLVGPSAAVIVISSVLIVQCFLFADGGLTALGANIFNMAIISGIGGWSVYYLITRMIQGMFGRIFAATFAAWCATVAAAVFCAAELAASGTVGWQVALPAMAGTHMLIGIGEAIITALVLSAVCTTRPELIPESTSTIDEPRPYGMVLAYGLVIAVGLALFVSPFASPLPDGLDHTVQALGIDHPSKPLVGGVMPDYQIRGLGAAGLGTSIAGTIGTVAALALGWGLARTLVPKVKPPGVSKEA